MKSQRSRVVTYLSEKYKSELQELCKEREEKEAMIVREILKEFLDHRALEKLKKERVEVRSCFIS
jgi:hypothetical protein